MTNSSGDVVENTTYAPSGEVLTGGEEVRYRYEAKEHDSLVGNTDFHFRKYKADWNLFTQPDTLIQNMYDPQTLNRYMFERGNSYGNVDSNGYLFREILYFLFEQALTSSPVVEFLEEKTYEAKEGIMT